jgi:hypothetical protein
MTPSDRRRSNPLYILLQHLPATHCFINNSIRQTAMATIQITGARPTGTVPRTPTAHNWHSYCFVSITRGGLSVWQPRKPGRCRPCFIRSIHLAPDLWIQPLSGAGTSMTFSDPFPKGDPTRPFFCPEISRASAQRATGRHLKPRAGNTTGGTPDPSQRNNIVGQ